VTEPKNDPPIPAVFLVMTFLNSDEGQTQTEVVKLDWVNVDDDTGDAGPHIFVGHEDGGHGARVKITVEYPADDTEEGNE
jgi:hypothetical protein